MEIEEEIQKHLLVNILKNEIKELLPIITWDRTYGGSGGDEAYSLIQTTDGGYAVAGATSSKGAGAEDFWVIKLDNQGNQIWDRTYGGSGNDGAYSIIQTTVGGYTVAGGTSSKGAGGQDLLVIKLDEQGNHAPVNSAINGGYSLCDIGPAGGYIFYDKGSYFDGWRYLEAAPASTEWTKQWGSYVATGATRTAR